MAALGEWGWRDQAAQLQWDYAQRPADHNYSLAYARSRQLGLEHEDAVQAAQRQVYGAVRSKSPEPESDYNRAWAYTQLSSALPAVQAQQAAVAHLEQAPVPSGISGRRMAMRYGLPALASLGALYGLAALMRPAETAQGGELVEVR